MTISSEDSPHALLFISQEGLAQPEIWERFLTRNEKARFAVYSHVKWPDRCEDFLNDYSIPQFPTGYAHAWPFNHTLAVVTANLFKKAIQNPLHERFTTLCDSCLPIAPPMVVAQMLQKGGWFAQSRDPWQAWHLRYSRLRPGLEIKPKEFGVASGWTTYTREQVELILKYFDTYLPYFMDMPNVEECIFTTILEKHGGPREALRAAEAPSTYYRCDIVGPEERTRAHCYRDLTPAEVEELKQQKAPFARKFPRESDVAKHLPEIWKAKTLLSGRG